MFKKIFLSGIIFLIILFLQIFFAEKNFSKDIEKNTHWNEKITKIYNKNACLNDIFAEMKKITIENKKAYYKTVEKIWTSLRKKSETVSYNFRVLNCNLEAICWGLQNFMFYWEDWTKKNNLNANSFINVIWSCPEIKFNRTIFKNCNINTTNDFSEILKKCREESKRILYWKDWNWWEYQYLEDNFANDAKKDKANFLAARIYDLNKKMRKLVDNMTQLKIKIVDIVDRIVCTEK